MPRHVLTEAVAADSDELCALVGAAPMEGDIRIALERAGSFFHGAQVQSEEPHVFLARDEAGRVVGCATAGQRAVFVNGMPRPVFYISDLRIHPDARGGILLARGFRFIRERLLSAPDAFAQTMILAGNHKATGLLTSGRAGLPRYFDAGEYACHAIRPLRGNPSTAGTLQVRAATAADIPAMQALFDREAPAKQFFPVYRFSAIGASPYHRDLRIDDFHLAWQGRELVGMAARWDQSGFKRTRIAGYARSLALARPAVNLWARWTGGFPLPPPGTAPRHAHLTGIVCRANDPAIFSNLLASLCGTRDRGPWDYFLCGLDRRDPLCLALGGLPTMVHRGRHHLVSFAADPRGDLKPGLFCFESGRI